MSRADYQAADARTSPLSARADLDLRIGPATARGGNRTRRYYFVEMATDIVKVIDHPAGERRVLIVVRADGCFGYCWQEWEGTEWSVRSISPDIYDSALSAETEARQQLAWLKVPLGPGP